MLEQDSNLHFFAVDVFQGIIVRFELVKVRDHVEQINQQQRVSSNLGVYAL